MIDVNYFMRIEMGKYCMYFENMTFSFSLHLVLIHELNRFCKEKKAL